LQNQIVKTQTIEEIAKQCINELERMEEEKKIIQNKLQGAIAETEAKWKIVLEN